MCAMLDADNNGRISIEELTGFVGAEPESKRATPPGVLVPIRVDDNLNKKPEERQSPKRKSVRPLTAEAVEQLRFKIKSAAYTGHSGKQLDVIFSRLDKDGSGYLEDEEIKSCLRRVFRIPPMTISDQEITSLCALLDADKSGSISIHELVAFVGPEPEVVRRPSSKSPGGHRKLQPMSNSPEPQTQQYAMM